MNIAAFIRQFMVACALVRLTIPFRVDTLWVIGE